MRAKTLSDLLKTGDRVAVSNITGREASAVTVASQKFCGNIVAGWALGKGGQSIEVPGREPIPVFASVEDMMKNLSKSRRPNKIVIYSPPPAVYGEVKDVVEHRSLDVETIFVITEHVSIEVTAKIAKLCADANIDVLGCNSLGMINSHDAARVGAVGGDRPEDSFRPGSVAIISNSGNMVNTMASYLQSAGLGVSYGVSTGKDSLILTPLKRLLELAQNDERTKMIILYIEPGGVYEKEAVELLKTLDSPKPIIAYITGSILETAELSLGHAGAVVEGKDTTAGAKMQMFDDYFGAGPFTPEMRLRKKGKVSPKRGIRITTLHLLPSAAARVRNAAGVERDFPPAKPLRLRPWFVDYGALGKDMSRDLHLHSQPVPAPYASQVRALLRERLGATPARRDMRNTSYASSNDGKTTRLFGRSIEKEMQRGRFAESLLFAWTGERPRDFEAELIERCLIASLSNGPGTISAQGAKLSTSAGNAPNTAMIATLACLGDVHGGNGRRGLEYLSKIFSASGLECPYDADHGLDLDKIVADEADRFSKARGAAKEAGTDYRRIPCLGHPVFRNEAVNFDPRERVLTEFLKEKGLHNIFLDFYHRLVLKMKEIGISRNVWAVNLDGAIASVTLGLCWKPLREKRMTVRRAGDVAFMLFALGRAAGAGGEFLDHQDHGSPMDMRIPVGECKALGRARD